MAVTDAAQRRQALALRVVAALDAEMTRKGISQSRLAERSGVGRQTVNYVLQAQRPIYLETLARLADALDCDVVIELRPRRAVSSIGHPPSPTT